MREIKFRAWDYNFNKFLYSNTFQLDGCLMNKWEQLKWFFYHMDTTHSTAEYSEPMQFTGLKDKNGKDIFEGDILHDNIEGPLEKVIWDGAGFVLTYGNHDYFLIGTFEIVGNIYENPELLD